MNVSAFLFKYFLHSIPDISEASSPCKLAKTKRWIRLLQKDIWQHHKRKDGRGAKAR